MNIKPPNPWLEMDDDTDLLCGNRAGFEVLADAIEKILNGTEVTVSLDGKNLCIPGIQLREPPHPSPPTEAVSTRIGLYIFLTLLVCILGLAGFGLIQLTNLILN